MKHRLILFGLFVILSFKGQAQATVTDADGNVYNTVTIGTQVWTKENLNTLKYSDSSDIEMVPGVGSWGLLTSGAYCDYNNTASYSVKYGKLYNWYAINNITNGDKNLCPTGWHVPNEAEFTTLITFLGGDAVAGGKLKETGYLHWINPNVGATNSSGFSARASGFRNQDGTYQNISSRAYFALASENTSTTSWYLKIFSDYPSVLMDYGLKCEGHSVRCVKDALPASAGIITGTATVCQGQNSVTYSVPTIANATSYVWTLPSGSTGTSTTNSIVVNYGNSAVSGNIAVKGNNSYGNGETSILSITVNTKPSSPTISLAGNFLHSDSPTNNQWFNQTGLLNGAINQNYTVTANGDYYAKVTTIGCSSDASNIINVVMSGIEIVDINSVIKIYPNPVSNELIIEMEGNNKKLTFEILNSIGQVISKGNLFEKTTVQTSNFAPGVYLIKLENGKTFEFKKIIKE